MTKRLICVLAFVAACGGDDGAGGTCASGAACSGDSICVVPAGSVTGTCTASPSECGSQFCSDTACRTALEDACSTTAVDCLILLNERTVTCGAPPPAAAAGETCSVVATCVEGTYCDIADIGNVGTCTELPAACAGEATCDCLQPVIDACPDGHACGILNNQGYVACHD